MIERRGSSLSQSASVGGPLYVTFDVDGVRNEAKLYGKPITLPDGSTHGGGASTITPAGGAPAPLTVTVTVTVAGAPSGAGLTYFCR